MLSKDAFEPTADRRCELSRFEGAGGGWGYGTFRRSTYDKGRESGESRDGDGVRANWPGETDRRPANSEPEEYPEEGRARFAPKVALGTRRWFDGFEERGLGPSDDWRT